MFCQLFPCSLMMILWSSTEFFFCKTNRKVISGKTPTEYPWEAPTPKVLNVFDETLSVLRPDTKLQYISCDAKRRLKYNVYPPSPLCWEIKGDIWISPWKVGRRSALLCSRSETQFKGTLETYQAMLWSSRLQYNLQRVKMVINEIFFTGNKLCEIKARFIYIHLALTESRLFSRQLLDGFLSAFNHQPKISWFPLENFTSVFSKVGGKF